MLTASLVLAAALAPADAPTPPPDAEVWDAGELQGEWEIVSVFVGKEDASHMYKGFRWVVAGSSHRIVDAAGVPALPMSVYVAADRSPPEVDEVDEVNRDYPTYRAVYRRNGDVLRWAESKGVERPRPTSFDPARGVTVWTLRRVK